MDFFQAQDQARKKSHLLVGYFLAATALIILAIYLVVSLLFFGATESGQLPGDTAWFSPIRFLIVAGSVLLVIGLATLFKINQLRHGGGVVAESLGGRKVHADTRDFQERQLLNVVEEMTIASGAPMPAVYILDNETGINAFAAGFSPNDAAVAVTRGTLEKLSRDELQGVIAHEFSHILNGDMPLNIKLAGILFGILVLAITGRIIFGSLRFSGGGRGGGKGSGGIVIAIFLTGLALFLIGYIGVFFGKLIQAAVSRQREFLADAAAVQFTRNPDGISGALKKIGGFSEHSTLRNGKAMNLAHMCFGRISKKDPVFFSLATHPPLLKRIRAIDPQFDGSFPPVDKASGKTSRKAASPAASGLASAASASAAPPPLPRRSAPRRGRERFRVGKAGLAASVGSLETSNIENARRQIAGIPKEIQNARHDTGAARAVILALVFDRDPASLLKQMNAVRAGAAPETASSLQSLSVEVRKLPVELRLPVLELMIPVLYNLPRAEYEQFLEVLKKCIRSDQHTDFWEFVLLRMVRRQVEPKIYPDRVEQATIRHQKLTSLKGPLEILFNSLAFRIEENPEAREILFRNAAHAFQPEVRITFNSDYRPNLANVERAIDQITQSTFAIRKRILETAHDLVADDGQVTIVEAEYLRMLAISFDCPTAPLQPDSR